MSWHQRLSPIQDRPQACRQQSMRLAIAEPAVFMMFRASQFAAYPKREILLLGSCNIITRHFAPSVRTGLSVSGPPGETEVGNAGLLQRFPDCCLQVLFAGLRLAFRKIPVCVSTQHQEAPRLTAFPHHHNACRTYRDCSACHCARPAQCFGSGRKEHGPQGRSRLMAPIPRMLSGARGFTGCSGTLFRMAYLRPWPQDLTNAVPEPTALHGLDRYRKAPAQ